jgi:hypothetical protein
MTSNINMNGSSLSPTQSTVDSTVNSLKTNFFPSFLNGSIVYLLMLTALSLIVSWGIEVFARVFLRFV